jgi:hypothetical protein
MSRAKGWRTVTLSILTMVSATVQASTDLIPPEALPPIMAFLGAAYLCLRFDTSGPVGKRE